MSISAKIKDLTMLALKDRVLTLVEKQTIINAALKEGTSESEIIQYLNNALEKRLKTYSKEDLTHCPHCGSLTPLISDDCLFCGESLSKGKQAVPPPIISGNEAEIIKNENKNTADENRNIKVCPNCGAPFPLISNICGYCGFVLHEQLDSDTNIKNLITSIQNSINELKNAPNPSFWNVVVFRSQILLLFAAAILLILSISYSTTTFFGWSVGLLLLAFIMLFISKREYSPVSIADNAYYNALYSHEMYTRTVDSLYGENAEARQLLEKYAEDIKIIKQNRNNNRKKIAVVFLMIIVVGFVLPFVGLSAEKKYQLNREKYSKEYQLSEIRKNIKPFEILPIHKNISPYLKCESSGVLSIEILPEISVKDFFLLGDNLEYRLRFSGVKLVATGNKLSNADTSKLSVVFWNKNNKIVDRKYLVLDSFDDDTKCDDNIFRVMQNGKGSYYADFVSKKWYNDIDSLKAIVDQAEYFTLNNY